MAYMDSGRRRVVITGMATINPLGDTLESYLDHLLAGVSGIKRWESLDVSIIESKIGGDLGNYDCRAALERYRDDLGDEEYKKVRKLFKTATFSARMGVLCALGAFQDAKLLGTEYDSFRISAPVGGHNLNSKYLYDNGVQFREEPEFIAPLSGVEGIDPSVPGLITESLGLHGPAFTIGGACSSGNLALRAGFRDIVTGECDRSVVTGGLFDMCTADLHASEFINAIVVRPDLMEHPEKASRPFDADRAGFVYSHGCGSLMLEGLDVAEKRGARIYAEVLGVQANSNANHQPQPSAEMQRRLIVQLLERTGVGTEEVDYVSCHATGTPVGDVEEAKAVRAALGAHADRVKLNAAKSMLGHTCWAAPIVETIGGILQMQRGRLHQTINIDRLDPEVDLDVCASGPVDIDARTMIKNSFGFGGLNCCSLIRRWDGAK
jgi:3-oxoacyl-(acyl-carrier-protein) synthase